MMQAAGRNLPNDPELMRWTASILRRRGESEQALALMEKAATLDPRNPHIAYALADAHYFLRHYEEADREFARSISLMPELMVVYVARVWASNNWDGDPERAAMIIEQMPNKRHPVAIFVRFFHHFYCRDFETALAVLDESNVEVYSESLWWAPKSILQCLAYDLLGDRAAVEKTCGQALTLIETELESHPEDYRVVFIEARTHALLDNWDQAIAAAERGLTLIPTVAEDAVAGAYHPDRGGQDLRPAGRGGARGGHPRTDVGRLRLRIHHLAAPGPAVRPHPRRPALPGPAHPPRLPELSASQQRHRCHVHRCRVDPGGQPPGSTRHPRHRDHEPQTRPDRWILQEAHVVPIWLR